MAKRVTVGVPNTVLHDGSVWRNQVIPGGSVKQDPSFFFYYLLDNNPISVYYITILNLNGEITMYGDIEDYRERIMSGEITYDEAVEQSYNYIGSGTYAHLGTHITPAGREAGWIYVYPALRFKGLKYREAGKTILQGLIDGHLELDERTTTGF